MKKLLSIITGFLVAAVAIAVTNTASTPVAAETCTTGAKYTDFEGSYSGRDTMTVWTKGNKKLCNDVKVNFASFKAPDNYNGKGFKNNPTALPQSQFYNKTVTLKKGTDGKTTVTVQVPNACTNYQIDAYIGPVQKTITTSEGFIDTNAIVGKLFQRTKTDCTVKVCNPATGEIIKVDEDEASDYKPVGEVACTSFPVCDFSSKTVKTIKGYQFDSNTMSKNVKAAECQPEPSKVRVCNPANGQIIDVKESDASKYKPVGDEACEDLEICVLDSGNTRTIKGYQYDSSKYSKDLDDAACTETPGKGGETPEVIAHTGPAEVVSAFLGTGSLAGAATAYIRSRRALRG